MNPGDHFSSEMELRPATSEDLAALVSVPYGPSVSSIHRERLSRQDRGEAVYLLAVSDNLIRGYLFLKWNGPGHPAVQDLIPAIAEFEDFRVDPDLRSRGIGSTLLEDAERRCRERDVPRLGLSVGVDNDAARTLYERSGFEFVPDSAHRVTWFVNDQSGREIEAFEDCLYMVKELV